MSLADIVEPLQQPLFTVLDTPVNWTEVLGFGSGALCVWLVARRHLFFILLFTQAGLYADAGLQIVFITLAAYGWWTWTHGGGPGLDGLPVRRTTRTEWTWLLAAGVVGIIRAHHRSVAAGDVRADRRRLVTRSAAWQRDRRDLAEATA